MDFEDSRVGRRDGGDGEVSPVRLFQRVHQFGVGTDVFVGCRHGDDRGSDRETLGHLRLVELLREHRDVVVYILDQYGGSCSRWKCWKTTNYKIFRPLLPALLELFVISTNHFPYITRVPIC